jgi:4-diphosphocytidyl-2-C-methyl-D-erythritol kinase
MNRSLVIEAPAKINLFLRVLHRREDGFHELETLFQSVSLADEVSVTIAEAGPPGEHLDVVGPDLGPVESNLAVRAVRLFRDVSGLNAGVHVRLLKRIPLGSGLGGGSSDAAAVLRCLSRLTSFEDSQALHGVASELGSDVAFFLNDSPLCLGRGRGETLTSLRALPSAPVVLSLPPVHVSTSDAYRELAMSRSRDGENGTDAAGRGGQTSAALPTALSWADIVTLAENDFERTVALRHLEITASLEGLRDEGASVALLSGSGAASFGLFGDVESAHRAAHALESRLGWPHVAVVTRTESPVPVTSPLS